MPVRFLHWQCFQPLCESAAACGTNQWLSITTTAGWANPHHTTATASKAARHIGPAAANPPYPEVSCRFCRRTEQLASHGTQCNDRRGNARNQQCHGFGPKSFGPCALGEVMKQCFYTKQYRETGLTSLSGFSHPLAGAVTTGHKLHFSCAEVATWFQLRKRQSQQTNVMNRLC